MSNTEQDTHARDQAESQLGSIIDVIERLTKAIDEDNQDAIEEIEQEIYENPLSVMVRDGWREPCAMTDEYPEEYEILLCTGGPAVRIVGKLDKHCEPDDADLQYQDWGTPWTYYPVSMEDGPGLMDFVRKFYYGA